MVKAPTISLNEFEIEFYHRYGYLSVSAVTTPEEIRWMKGVYDRLFENGAGRKEGNWLDLSGTEGQDKSSTLPQIMYPQKYVPELQDTLYWANATQIARQLLGEAAEFQFDHAINKPPRAGSVTPWHQDEAYWDPALEYDSSSIWMPLQEATLDNGCMQFVPGSQALGVQPHHPINEKAHGLEIDQIDLSRSAACPLPAGGATIHSSRTLHYTGPNLTEQPRRAYILAFGVLPRPRSEPRNFYWRVH